MRPKHGADYGREEEPKASSVGKEIDEAKTLAHVVPLVNIL